MMEALVALGKDHTLRLFAESEALHLVETALISAAVAAERERCAKVCEWVAGNLESAEEDAQAMSIGAQSCADQIRAGA